jgi:hypothetical protein
MQPKAKPGSVPAIVETELIVELKRILDAKQQKFRLQFFGADRQESIWTLEVWASDATSATHEAAEILWPAGAVALRILDLDGQEIVERLKTD